MAPATGAGNRFASAGEPATRRPISTLTPKRDTSTGKIFSHIRSAWFPEQRALVERVAAARPEIARERAEADRLAAAIAAETETLLLGHKPSSL